MTRWLFRSLLAFVCLIITVSGKSQTTSDSCGMRMSLLTCSPGAELYSTFGHSALRLVDSSSGVDVIFNYGTFDFENPNFYSEFVRGKLLYYVSTQDYEGFREDYRYEGRSIIEQQLNLSCTQKQKLRSLLINNLREENKYYKYDFLFDNCSTRLADIVEASSDGQLQFNDIVGQEPPTFRELLHVYLRNGQMFWSRLGIDILLGSRIDREISSREAMFLPDYLMQGFDSATINQQPLVRQKSTLLETDRMVQNASWLTRPIMVTAILMVLVWALMFTRRKWASRILLIFDHFFFFLLGALGILLLFMWFATDHLVCSNNFNLLWALPTHIVIAFVVRSKKRWVLNYFRIMAVWYFLLFFGWAILPQDMNTAIVPLVIIAFMRSVVRFRKFN